MLAVRRTSVALTAIGLVLATVAAASANIVLDQEHLNGYGYWIISQRQSLGQSFTVGKAGVLIRVEIPLARHNTVPNSGVNLDLHALDGGGLSKDRSRALATGYIPAESVMPLHDSRFNEVDYGAAGLCVLPGDVLAIAATTDADKFPGGGTNPYAWTSPGTLIDYRGGDAFIGLSGEIMHANSHDLAFRTYVDTGAQWRGGNFGGVSDWGRTGNWSPGAVPDNTAALATFGTSGSRATVDLGTEDRTLRMVLFDQAVSTTIQSTGGHSLILDNGASPASLVVEGTHWLQAPLAIHSDVRMRGTGQFTFSGPLRGVGGLIHGAGGTTILAAPGTFTGPTRLTAGTLQLNHPQALAKSTLNMRSQDTGVVSFDGITEAGLGGLSGQRGLQLVNTTGAAVALSVGANDTDTLYYGSLAGKGGLKKVGTGTLTLAGVSSFEGPTIVGQGVLELARGSAITGFGGDGADWHVNNNRIGGPAFANDVLTLTDGGGDQSRSAFFSQRVPAAAGFSVEFTYTVDESDPADGITFTIHNDPRGTAALGGRSHTLGYAAEGSRAAISPSLALEFNVFGSQRGVRWATNGAIRNYLSTAPVNLVSGNPIDVNLVYDAGTQTLLETLHEQNTTNTKTFTWPGIDLSSILGTPEAYVGFTGATGGWTATQRISNFSAVFQGARDWDLLPTGTALRVASGATLDLGGVHQTVGSLADGDGDGGGGTVRLGGATLTFGGDGSDTVFSGVIDGDGAVVKTGSAKTILAGDHTYNGPTTIESGTLVVNGSLSSRSGASVQDGAALGGHGSVAGEVVVRPGGRLMPGTSAGMLSIDRLTLETGSVLEIEFGPSGNDRIDVTALNGLLIEDAGLVLLNEDTAEPFATPGTYPILHFDGEIGGSGGLAALSIFNPQPGAEYSFDATGNPGWVSLTIVPEPATGVLATGALAALGLLGLARSRRQRQRERSKMTPRLRKPMHRERGKFRFIMFHILHVKGGKLMLTTRRTFVSVAVAGLLLATATATAATIPTNVVRQDDLAGWWKMGEGATWNGSAWSVPDASANSNTATSVQMSQGDLLVGYPFNPYPETSYAMRTDSFTPKHLQTAYDPSLVMASSFTVTAWVRQSSPSSGDRMIAGRLDSRLSHNYFFQLANKRVSVGFANAGGSGGSWPKIAGGTSLADNRWYHVAGVFDDASDMLRVYVNGQQDGQMSLTGTPRTSSAHGFSIGANGPEGNRWFNGSIDDVRIYNVALPTGDVAAIYNGGQGDFEPVPEPSTFVLLASCLVLLGWYARRRSRRASGRW